LGRGLARQPDECCDFDGLLSVLTLIFIFQATLARYRLAHRPCATVPDVLVWPAGPPACSSIVNVMNYLRAPFMHLDIGVYLAEPLMVIIAGYTLISLLIGRGVFCGWRACSGRCRNCSASCRGAARATVEFIGRASSPWMGHIAAAVVLLVMTETTFGGHRRSSRWKTAITSKFTRGGPRTYARLACDRGSPSGPIAAFCVRWAACLRR
jgi:hypothetical protein